MYKNYVNLYPRSGNVAEVRAQIAKLESAVAADETAKRSLPHGIVTPERRSAEPEPAPTPAPRALVTVETRPEPARKPVYKKWWFWTALVGGAAVAAGVTAAVVVTQSRPWNDIPAVGPGRMALVQW